MMKLDTQMELMMRYTTCYLLLFIAAVLTGCASGSALVTGQTRPAIEDHTTVRILTEMPEGGIWRTVVDTVLMWLE